MSGRPDAPPAPLLVAYDPFSDLSPDPRARLVAAVVEEAITVPLDPLGPGQPPFDPRRPLPVLADGSATGIRSSRQREPRCRERLPSLVLTGGDPPGSRTLCRARVAPRARVEPVGIRLFPVAGRRGLKRRGHRVGDSPKRRAAASQAAGVKAEEDQARRAELARLLEEAAPGAAREEPAGPRGTPRWGPVGEREPRRDIGRRVRKQRAPAKRAQNAAGAPPPNARGRAAPGGAAAAPATPPAAAAGPAAPAGAPAPHPAAPAAPPAGAPPAAPPAEPAVPAAPVPPAPAAGGRPRRTQRRRPRLKAGRAALAAALAEQRPPLCLTDPDARMRGEGRARPVREGDRFEVAVAREAGLWVVGQGTPEGSDNARRAPLGAAAPAPEPAGVTAVDGERGFDTGGALGRLIRAGIDPCVPDSAPAGDLHRGQPVGTGPARSRGRVAFG
jgi:hypothetical protein